MRRFCSLGHRETAEEHNSCVEMSMKTAGKTNAAKTVAAYLAALPDDQRRVLTRLRA